MKAAGYALEARLDGVLRVMPKVYGTLEEAEEAQSIYTRKGVSAQILTLYHLQDIDHAD